MEQAELKLGMKVKLNSEGRKVFGHGVFLRDSIGNAYDLDAIHTITEIKQADEARLTGHPECTAYVRTDLNSDGIWAALVEPFVPEPEPVEEEEEIDESPIQVNIIAK